ncbi:MAG: hypothetical protein H8E13_22280 [Actinobacteria bacterium]|nr:hypothetical protein [Actinomycetota bacterium]
MESNNNYLSILFRNMVYLLKKNLKEYKIHPVEKKYFKETLEFFNDIQLDINSFTQNKKFSSNNLTSLYAIPNLVTVYENHKTDLKNRNEMTPKDEVKFFNLLYRLIHKYYNDKELDENSKSLLSYFFEELANEYEPKYRFEKIETLPFS